nr:hypothetical protein [Tanacetum cinerariifolium]
MVIVIPNVEDHEEVLHMLKNQRNNTQTMMVPNILLLVVLMLVLRINDLESQMIKGKLVLLDDEGKPIKPSKSTLPSSSNVVSKKVDDLFNEDDDSKVAEPEWSRHVTIVHQIKDLHIADYTQLYDFLKYNQKEVDELKAEQLAKIQDRLALMENSNNPYAFPAPHQDQPSFNQNYITTNAKS